MLKSKKVIILLVLLLLNPLYVFAEERVEEMVKLWVDGYYVLSTELPFIEDSRTFVPIRFISKELGFDVNWDNDTRQVTIKGDETAIVLTIDSPIALVNGRERVMDVAPVIRFDRTYVPMRFVAENMGRKVSFNDKYKVAIIGENYDPGEFYPGHFYYLNDDYIYDTYFELNIESLNIKMGSGENNYNFENGDQLFLTSTKTLIDLIGLGAFYENQEAVYVDTELKVNGPYIEPSPYDPIQGVWEGTDRFYDTDEERGLLVKRTFYIGRLDSGKYAVVSAVIFFDENYPGYDGDFYVEVYENVEYDSVNGLLKLRADDSYVTGNECYYEDIYGINMDGELKNDILIFDDGYGLPSYFRKI